MNEVTEDTVATAPFAKTRPSRSRPRIFFLALLLPTLALGSSPNSGQAQESCPPPAEVTRGFQGPFAHVRYLADDALQGREVGSPGARCAGDYIAGVFRDLGLQGVGPNGSFFQSFEVQMGSILGEGSALEVGSEPLAAGSDWIPFGFSSKGEVSATLVYGGSGVGMPGREEDHYAQLDIEDRIVVVESADPHGSAASSMAGDPHFKASTAARQGAAGVLILLGEGDPLPDLLTEQRPSVRIPAAAIAGSGAEALREAAKSGAHARLVTPVEPRSLEARNVVAMIPGASPEVGQEVVILGAHYDHLGLGGDGSLAPDEREVHNGADDNASGTAALMEAARRVMESGERPARSLLFIAFTGEEKGLWGSAHYAGEPILPLERTVAMINMDMVGRLRDNTLTVYGTGTAEEWPSLLDKVNEEQPEPFVIAPIADGFGPSDHSSFYGESIPVLMLFTNTHADYHRPEDDWWLINPGGMERIAAFAADVAGAVAGTGSEAFSTLTLVEGAGPPHGAAMPTDEDAPAMPGYGAYMGTIPDMTPQDFGVRITGVREGSPAQKAGLQAGDILVELGGKEISDLYAYTYALREHKPGDEVTVVVLREGERTRFQAVLGQRR